MVRELLDAPVDILNGTLVPALRERMTTRMQTEMIGMSLIRASGRSWNEPNTEAAPLGYQHFIHVLTSESETSTDY